MRKIRIMDVKRIEAAIEKSKLEAMRIGNFLNI